jgi:hypothetical protein
MPGIFISSGISLWQGLRIMLQFTCSMDILALVKLIFTSRLVVKLIVTLNLFLSDNFQMFLVGLCRLALLI